MKSLTPLAPLLLPLIALTACTADIDETELDEDIAADAEALTLAGPPSGLVVSVETDDQFGDISTPGGNVLLARTAPRAAGESHGWALRLDLHVRNQSSQVRFIKTFSGLKMETEIVPVSSVEVPPESAVTFSVPVEPSGTGAPPSVLAASLEVVGYDQPLQFSAPLAAYENNTPSGGYRLPFNATDIPTASFLAVGSHANTPRAKYAIDFGAARWDATLDQWTPLKSAAATASNPGSANAHFIAWDLPVRAVRTATIRRCVRSQPDHMPGQPAPGDGNHLILQLGNGEWAVYRHLKQASIPATLCPIEGSSGSNTLPLQITVATGQELGRVGNSGSSDGPTLDFQISGEAPLANDATVRSLPINFFGAAVHGTEAYEPSVSGAWYHIPETDPATLGSHVVVLPTL